MKPSPLTTNHEKLSYCAVCDKMENKIINLLDSNSIPLEFNSNESEILAKKRSALFLRAKIYRSIHEWFASNDFLLVETPIRLPCPALEDYIDAEESGTQWLRTSPELHMKRLLAAEYENIYQLGPCFRKDERGRRHLPEFAMLEWYRLKADWRDILQDTKDLLRFALQKSLGTAKCLFQENEVDFSAEWDEITVEEAFLRYGEGITLQESLQKDCFEEILVSKIEPFLGFERPLVLSEYPLECSGLSRSLPDDPGKVERFEIYVCGIELGNACSELIDVNEQLERFKKSAALRASENRAVYPLDLDFMAALQKGMQDCAGIAIGIDRLMMIAANAKTIDEVVAFPE